MEPPDLCHVPPEALELDDAMLRSLPGSARRVLASILDHGPATQPELAELAGLPVRTVRFAARRLLDKGLVNTHVNLQDVRRRHFCIARRVVDPSHLRSLGLQDGQECVVVVVAHGDGAPSARWRDVLVPRR